MDKINKSSQKEEKPFTFEVYGKVFDKIKYLEGDGKISPKGMYVLSPQTIREIIKFVIEEVR